MKRISVLFLTLTLMIIGYKALSQDSIYCNIQNVLYYTIHSLSGDCTPVQNGDWEKYRNMKTYMPYMDPDHPLQNPPIKTIEININIIQKDDGSGNFPNNQATTDRLTAMISNVNSFYEHYDPSDPISWVTELPNFDSRIRFSLGETGNERIYFYKNTAAWDDTWPSTTIEPYISQNYPERLEQLNVYIFGNPNNNNWAHANMPSWTNFNYTSWVVLFYWENPVSDWATSEILAHEFGHNLDLLHTYYGGGASAICDQLDENFLKDVFLIQLPDISNCPHTGSWSDDPYFENGDGITNNLLGGTQSSKYISPMQAGQMHRSLAVTSIRKYVKSDKSEIPLVINGTHKWDFDIKLYRDLIVSSNSHLIISCHLVMTPNTKIIIEPGGKLTVDGGVIGTDIFEKGSWQGIEVWGNTNMHQYDDENGNNAQGMLILKNGATIENAVNAVTNWKPGDWDMKGGIIFATDAHFINNRRSVEFMKYQNYDPATGKPTRYRASFKNCEFVYNDDYHIPTAQRDHVTMWSVNGVTFRGCTFANEITAEPNTGRGIYSIDAGYTVTNFCNDPDINCPGGGVRSLFNGFERGIVAENETYVSNLISILNSDFIDNGTGIFLSSVLAPVIVNDTFELGAVDDDCGNKVGFGVQLDNTKMFAVEQNYFTTYTPSPPAQNIGIRVNNTHNAWDELYKNDFNTLDVAIQAEGKNWDTYDWTGLAYYCNDNQNNEYDFYVDKIGKDDGIQKNQGSSSRVAGNTFSPNASNEGNFYNESYKIHYYYDQNGQYEDPVKRLNVDLYPETLTKTCPSHYGGGSDIRMSSTAYQQRETDYNNASASYSSASSNYDAANDSSTRSYWAGKMSYYNTDRARAAYDIIRSNMDDTIAHPELFKTWMEKLNTYASAQAVVDYYLQQGDYTTALNKVDSLPYRFAFTAYDSVEYPLYKDFKHKQATWLSDGRTLFDLTQTEVNSLIAIADSSKGIAGAQARAILLFAYPSQYSYVDCPDMPGNSVKSAEVKGDTRNIAGDLAVTAKPNPANNRVTFTYTLPVNTQKATLSLYAANGKTVYRTQLNTGSSSLQYNCEHLKAGIYYYTVATDAKTLSGKLVIVR